jgi:uncharacterized protein YdeI (YjbR/CyaY-like superfamily)
MRTLTKNHMIPVFFANPSEFHAWLEKNHDKASEIWVGFHKKSSGKPGITMPESVDEALCFGWIDSVRRSINDTSYANRFTQRKTRSTWSAINIKRAKELITLGRMQPTGLKAFERRTDERSSIYSYEQRQSAKLSGDFKKRFRGQQEGLELLPLPSAVVSKSSSILGPRREKRRNKVEATCKTHRRF